MGGRLGRKRRGYNVSEPKENKSSTESTEKPEVKHNEPENKGAAKDQFKATSELQPGGEAPKKVDEEPGEKQTTLVTADVEVTERSVNAVVGSASTELARGSETQENVTPASLVEITKQMPDQEEHCASTEADVRSNAVPETGSADEVPDESMSSKTEPETNEIPDGETLKSNLDAGETLTNIAKDPSTGKLSLDEQVALNLDEHLEGNLSGNLGVQADADKVLEGVSAEVLHTATPLPVNHEAPLVPAPKEMETSIPETQPESPVKCDFSKEDEEPKLGAIIEETPIDVVLKNEVALCADLEKDVTKPSTQDKAWGKVVEQQNSTTQITPDSGEQSDCVQDILALEDSKVAELEDHSQSLKGSGNVAVDMAQVDSCGVTDAVQADPFAGESGPENTCLSTEMTETNYEQTVEPVSCQDSIEISLLKTNSELIPDIKLTVYGEGLQEEEVKSDAQLAFVDEAVENIVQDTNVNPQPPNEVLEENGSLLHSVEVAPENRESSDEEMIKLETSRDPAPENPTHLEDVSTKVIAEKTSSTENSTVFVGGGKLNESITSKIEDDYPEISVTNGTTLDGEQRNQGTVEDGQSITGEVESLQTSSLEPIVSKTIEKVIENLSPEESCLDSGNQTLHSGPLDMNVE
ncbi:uncharacterized protein LOC144594829 [Rhinoraja longicauda]